MVLKVSLALLDLTHRRCDTVDDFNNGRWLAVVPVIQDISRHAQSNRFGPVILAGRQEKRRFAEGCGIILL